MRILASPAFSNESVNPYNALLYRQIEALGGEVHEYSHKKLWTQTFSIVHFHWPDGYINRRSFIKTLQRILVFVISFLIAKMKKSKIVWTVHNLEPHDAFFPSLSKLFMSWFVSHCDGLIFLNSESRASFLKLYPSYTDIPSAIIPHGHYRTAYQPAIEQTQAKKMLGIDGNQQVLLYVGMIKPYKNVDHLIKLFNEIKLDNWILVVAGHPESKELVIALERIAMGNPRIRLIFKFIDKSEMTNYLSAADAVILPYKHILNSGTLLLALSYDKPVIAPLTGAVKSMEADLGEEWIYSYTDELTKIKLINSLTLIASLGTHKTCPLEKYNWDSIGQLTYNFYNQVLSRSTQEDHAVCH